MQYTIKNHKLKASISSRGAELQSLLNKNKNKELMWQAQPEYWAKHSPVLFPFIGEHKDGHYIYEGEKHHLPRHGFAFRKAFEVQMISEQEILFVLQDDAETRSIYPFKFRLSMAYKLQDEQLICHYKVENLDPISEMYFSLGAHPAFDLPGNYADYYLQFNQDDVLQRLHSQHGLILDERSAIGLQEKQLPLAYELFYQDALVLHGLKSNIIAVGHREQGLLFEFRFENYPYFGIWAAKNANFICLEPWCGIADHYQHQGQLQDKMGIIKLLAEGCFEQSWAVCVF